MNAMNEMIVYENGRAIGYMLGGVLVRFCN